MGMEWRLLNALFVVVVSEAFVGVVGSRVRCFFFLRCVSLMAVVVVFVDIGVVAVVVAFVVVLAVGWRCWLLPLLSFCVSTTLRVGFQVCAAVFARCVDACPDLSSFALLVHV